MNQGKLEVVKQEMARVNINILAINELTSMGMGKFNSDDHYIYYCGQKSLRRNVEALKKVLNALLWSYLKNDRMVSVHFQGKQFNITVIQVYVATTNAKEDEVEWFYEDLQDLLELTPKKKKKKSPFNHRGLEYKLGSQKILGVTGKFGLEVQNEARQRPREFCQENTLVIANTLFQQNKR